MADRVGQQVGAYRLLRLLGEGGFAEVYLGEHAHLGTQAAVKVLSASLSPEEIDHFREEARIIARLKHPHIVRVLDFGVEGDLPFLVMEYAPGGTLRQRHPAGSRLTPAEALPYVQQMASALQYAHEQKLIHRDVKPENMLISARGDILLSDFGIALVAQSSRYQSTQEVAGTLAYMAPEQIQGHPRPASDQYALGIVIYEWLAGERPFSGGMSEVVARHLSIPPPPLSQKQPGLSPAVEQVVLMALAKDPRERFASMQAFARAFEQARSMPAAPPAAVQPSERPPGALDATIPAQRPPTSGVTRQVLPWPQAPTMRAELEASQPPAPAPPAKPRNQPRRRRARALLSALLVVALVLAGGGLAWRALATRRPTAQATSTLGTTPTAAPTRFTEFSVPNAVELLDITAGPDGNLWFTGAGTGTIGRMTPAGQATLFPLTLPGFSIAPFGITAGPDGNLWFTACAFKVPANAPPPCIARVGRMTPAGEVTEFDLPVQENQPWGITAGPDGNLWFTAWNDDDQNQVSNAAIWRVTPLGVLTEFPLPAPNEYSYFSPYEITDGPDGNLWFTGTGIGRITPAGQITLFPVDTGAVSITSGPDGNLWFTGNGIGRITPAGQVTEFPIPASTNECSLGSNNPDGITAGPDGNLWFTEGGCSKIGRITPGGTITEFALPATDNLSQNPWVIVTGQDGNLWFMEGGSTTIGRFTPGA